ncbi:hypothetical protein JCM18750_27900 [Halostagnicola bangensis]
MVSADQQRGYSQEEFERHIQKANKIELRAGIEERVNYLEEHDIPTTYTRLVNSRPDKEEGMSTQEGTGQGGFCVEPDKCDGDIGLRLTLSFNYQLARYYASLSMRYYYMNHTDMYGYEGPENPTDGAGILWDEDHWQVIDRNDLPGSTTTSEDVSWDNGSWNQEGVGYRVNSKIACMKTGTTDRDEYDWSRPRIAGVYLRTGPDHEDDSAIHAAYDYSWEEGDVSGVSVAYPWSVSHDVSYETKTQNLQTDIDGDSLRVKRSDS